MKVGLLRRRDKSYDKNTHPSTSLLALLVYVRFIDRIGRLVLPHVLFKDLQAALLKKSGSHCFRSAI